MVSIKKDFNIVATTLYGLEQVLAREIGELGGTDIRIDNRAVHFRGGKETLYKVNYCCRTALRIFKKLSSFSVRNAEQLYQGVFKLNWPDFFDVKQTFMVDSVVYSPYFSHTGFVALKTKDAIADRFRQERNSRPSVDTHDPTIRIMVHISGDQCTISLDSSGESLHRRGYRVAHGIASLNEVLAAGMILLTGWDRKSTFLDPMCGSGTLPVEAALLAKNIPPGYFRETYSFMNWKTYEPALFNKIKSESHPVPVASPDIYGSDQSPKQIKVARSNLERAGLSHSVRLRVLPFDEVRAPGKKGLIIMNPPYGERIRENDIEKMYSEVGDQLKRYFTGWHAWILSAHQKAINSIGLHPTRKIELFNGELKCKYREYVLYKGSKQRLN